MTLWRKHCSYNYLITAPRHLLLDSQRNGQAPVLVYWRCSHGETQWKEEDYTWPFHHGLFFFFVTFKSFSSVSLECQSKRHSLFWKHPKYMKAVYPSQTQPLKHNKHPVLELKNKLACWVSHAQTSVWSGDVPELKSRLVQNRKWSQDSQSLRLAFHSFLEASTFVAWTVWWTVSLNK